MKKFWIIMPDDYNDWYFQRYQSPEDAVKEAEILAKRNPGTFYHVMESIGVAETPKAVYTSYDAPSTNPVMGVDLRGLDPEYKPHVWPNINHIGPGLVAKPEPTESQIIKLVDEFMKVMGNYEVSTVNGLIIMKDLDTGRQVEMGIKP